MVRVRLRRALATGEPEAMTEPHVVPTQTSAYCGTLQVTRAVINEVGMKYCWILFLTFTAFAGSSAQVQGSAPGTAPNADATLLYIHTAWDSLVRSMSDCHSLADVKITANPVLYIPAEMQAPRELAAAEHQSTGRHTSRGTARGWATLFT